MHDLPFHGVAPLSHLGVLRVAGADAVSFLQGQLTQDFALLPAGEARLAAFLSAKGRMQASFVGFIPTQGEILLICSRDLLEATRRRLSMFVMRAKAVLTDATDHYVMRGLVGEDAIKSVANNVGPTCAVVALDAGNLIFLPPAGDIARALWIAPAGTPPPAGPQLDPALWTWGEVMSGVATLTAPVVDLFVPQMLNYESVGGVNFKKGCYPGQEIVARSQFRGTLKRRAFIAHTEQMLSVGDEVFHSSDAEQPCGTVVQAAAAPDGGFDAIVSLQVAATESGTLHAGAPTGALLSLQPLPYPLLADI